MATGSENPAYLDSAYIIIQAAKIQQITNSDIRDDRHAEKNLYCRSGKSLVNCLAIRVSWDQM